jgi:DNA-binding GntR family transcriptional regulator
VISSAPVDGGISSRRCSALVGLFRMERIRLAGDEPLALDTVWLPAHLGAPLLEADFTHTGLYDELAARAGVRVDGGREHIRAIVGSRTVFLADLTTRLQETSRDRPAWVICSSGHRQLQTPLV